MKCDIKARQGLHAARKSFDPFLMSGRGELKFRTPYYNICMKQIPQIQSFYTASRMAGLSIESELRSFYGTCPREKIKID